MSNLGQWLFAHERDTIQELIARKQARTGTVMAVTGNRVRVTDPLTSASGAELLDVLGTLPKVGERVAVLTLADGSKLALVIGNKALRQGPPNGGPGSGYIQPGRSLYLSSSIPLGAMAGVTLTANRLYYIPVWMPHDLSLTGFTFEVTTAVNGSVQLGLYTASSVMIPGDRVMMSTKTVTNSLGVKSFAATYDAEGGRYYFVGLCSTSAMAIKGSVSFGNLPALRGGTHINAATNYNAAYEDLAGGWTNINAVGSSASSLGDFYLQIGVNS